METEKLTSRFDAADSASDEGARDNALISTLEGEIVPRLLMLFRSFGPGRNRIAEPADTIDAGDVEELARLLLAHGHDTAFAFVQVVRQRGVAYERIYTELLVPAAHCLADRWERSDLSYPQLKLGLGTLQSLVAQIRGAARHSQNLTPAESAAGMPAVAKRCC